MPRIPVMNRPASLELPKMSPGMASAPDVAIARAGQDVEQTGRYAANVFQQIQDKEKAAEDALKLMEYKDRIDKGSEEIASQFEFMQNHEDFEEYGDLKAKELHDSLGLDKVSPEVARATEHYFNQKPLHLSNAIKVRKFKVMEQKGRIALGNMYDSAIEDYANETDPTKQEIIKNNFEMGALTTIHDNLVDPVVGNNFIRNFDKDVKVRQEKNAEFAARSDIAADPELGLDRLNNPDFYQKLDPLKRVELIEHAQIRVNQKGTRLEKLNKAIQDENESHALNDYTEGLLDLETLKAYRKDDPETGKPGLSDSFYSHYYEVLRSGKDIVTDQDTFNRLYLKDDLREEDITAEQGKLSVPDRRVLNNRILQERREDVRDAKAYRRQTEAINKEIKRQEKAEGKALAAEARREATEEKED